MAERGEDNRYSDWLDFYEYQNERTSPVSNVAEMEGPEDLAKAVNEGSGSFALLPSPNKSVRIFHSCAMCEGNMVGFLGASPNASLFCTDWILLKVLVAEKASNSQSNPSIRHQTATTTANHSQQ